MEESKYTFKMVEMLVVSSDLEERQEKAGKAVEVTFLFKDWTAQDLANRLMVSNSPKVSAQAILRKMKVVPSTYTYEVPKAGTRAAARPVDYEKALVQAIGVEKAKVLIAKYGDAEKVLQALNSIL